MTETDLRRRLAEAILKAADEQILAEWICCEPINPAHELCREGDATRRMVRALILDDPIADRQSPVMDALLDALADHEADELADQTMLKGLTVKDGGVNLELVPPREIAAVWAHCAIGMLGDAPNYTETEVTMPSVSMEISPAGTYERYALIVQRVGKLTPHEARQQAERERDELRAAVERVRELAAQRVTDPGVQYEILAALDGDSGKTNNFS